MNPRLDRLSASALGRGRLVMALLGVGAMLSGCSSVGEGYQAGELGNGGFYFACDSAVSCDRFEQDAAKFPSAVSLGSEFTVRFVRGKESSGAKIELDDSPSGGITVAPVGEYLVSRGPQSLVAVKPGYATLASRDAAGKLIDYTVLRVARPDTLVVYRADDVSADPSRIVDVALALGDRRTFRAFAQENMQVLGGSLQVAWSSTNPAIVAVESTTDGRATIVARSAGAAKLVAVGGTFTQEIPVQVAP